MGVANRKPKADFVVRLVGARIRPWTVPMRTMARVMEAIQRLVDQRDDDGDASADSAESIAAAVPPKGSPRMLHLLQVRGASAAYAVAAHAGGAAALRVIQEAGAAIEDPEHAEWSSISLSAIKELSEIGKSFTCEIELRKPGRGRRYGSVLARITPETYHEIERVAFVFGTTSIFAKIERVGGATEMHCGIRLPESPRRMVICRVQNEETVRELGRYIYQHVTLWGDATWYRHNWQLRHLVIHAIQPPKAGSILEALKRIHDAGGDAWDEIEDPNALIAEIRGA